MNKLRLAVIGCGHLGRIHARLLSEIEQVQLVAAVDPDPAARQAVAGSLNLESCSDYRQLPGQVDAAVLAAPTSMHAKIALYLMERGIHLLVEKPLAPTAQDAQRMMLASARHAVVLAVGHVERFNPAFLAVRRQSQQPCAIEAARTGGFTFRSTDVGVVLDLMIHDLDLVLSLVPDPVVQIEAVGLPVVTEHEDVAQARIEFANGCVANLKASRTSPQAERQMTVYERDQHLFVDFNQRSVQVMLRSNSLRDGSFCLDRCPPAQIEALKGHVFDQLLPVSTVDVAEANPLRDELVDFVDSVRGRHRPRVSAEEAYRCVRLAEQIQEQIRRSWHSTGDDSVQPQRRAA
jgi:predicted dehydrogenase